MPSGQEKIHEFPEDGAFWFVKWIDEFCIPHLGTRSASVGVILQKLPFTKISDLTNLSPEDLLPILGQRAKIDPTVEVLQPHPVVMPGTLPLLHIGAVYHNKVKVGELPTRSTWIDLYSGGQDGEEIALGEKIAPPPKWNEGFPHYLLNKYEYSVVPYKMSRSRCLVVSRQDIFNEKPRRVIYIIPRMAIFKAFYACHTELAKAFCNGPWSNRLKDVICLIDWQSGLKTEVDSTGNWNVILQTLVPDDFAQLLALYYFDPFARACAESIYAKSLQDRGARMLAPWYASAPIPFHSNNSEKKFPIEVRGFFLRSWKFKDENDCDTEIQKFLVTEIVGSAWPDYVPDIGYERANSGQAGAIQTKVDGPRPYKNTSEAEASDSETEVDGEHDADAGSPPIFMSNTEFCWLNRPAKKKLQKKSSQRYTDSGGPPPLPKPGNTVSTGEHTNQQDTNIKGEAEVTIRQPEKRFDHILEVFTDLQKMGFIESMQVFPCTIAGKQIRRGSLECWSFIDDHSRMYKYRPRRGWRLAEYDPKSIRNCKYRSALVVKFQMGDNAHYWIEIECRGKESGYRSPLLSNAGENSPEVIAIALEIIAKEGGINLKQPLNRILSEYGVIADCYKHVYESKSSSNLDIESVKRFLIGR